MEKCVNNIRFRVATMDDITKLVELREIHIEETDLNYVEGYLDSYLFEFFTQTFSSGQHIEFVAEEDGVIVATLGASCYYQLPDYKCLNGRSMRIFNVYTLQSYRNRGIATKLLDFSIDHLKKSGYGRISLHSSTQGMSLYEKRGFRKAINEFFLLL